MITARWDDEQSTDIDLWIKGPKGRAVGYTNKDNGYITLSRDDLGVTNDTFVGKGNRVRVLKRNIEDIQVRGLVPGDYIVNLHYYSPGAFNQVDRVETVTVELLDLNPRLRRVIKLDIDLGHRAEKTAFVFTVDESGAITEVDTTIFISIRQGLETPDGVGYD